MYAWAIYDIQNNRSRKYIARFCKQKGLIRVQKSVFLGNIKKRLIEELLEEVEPLLNLDQDRFYIVYMTQKDFHNMTILGQGFDKLKASKKRRFLIL